jgi:hypothetical protein
MLAEILAASLVGLAALALVLHPLLRPPTTPAGPPEPLDPDETPRGVALAALKEIDFDLETGKLSEGDYQFLKAKYTAAALEALRAERDGINPEAVEVSVAGRVPATQAAVASIRPRCAVCGPRPEPDATFCSTCGLDLGTAAMSNLRLTPPTQAPAPIR